jgi:hypothetical protein
MRRSPGRMPHGRKLLVARIKERNLTRPPRILNRHQGYSDANEGAAE